MPRRRRRALPPVEAAWDKMAEFVIEIAGVAAQVCSLFDSTRDYCRAYLTDSVPELAITVSREELDREQEALRREALEEGFRVRIFPDPFLDRAVVQRKLAQALLDRGILLVHGSALAVDGQGYLFTAKSVTGKSTHTRLWRQLLGQRAVMVNDDKPFVIVKGRECFLCGAPWSGKHGLDTNITVPLKAVCILDRGTENRIVSISPEEALPVLLKQSAPPEDAAKLPRFQTLVAALAYSARLWRLHCTKEQEAAQVAFHAMSR